MKYFKSLIIFAILVIFPLISWYYLQSGLDFRKDLMKELEGEGFTVNDLELPADVSARLLNKTSMIIYPESNLDADDLSQFFNQFAASYTFQLLNADSTLDGIEVAKANNWINVDIRPKAIKEDAYASLVDTSGKIRYQYVQANDIKRMIEHLAVVIPRKPQKDIVTKAN